MARASTQTKNNALSAIYTALENSQAAILAANQIDMNKAHQNNLDSALLDRLELYPARFKGMLQGLKDVISLKDPIGEITDMAYRPIRHSAWQDACSFRRSGHDFMSHVQM